MTLRLHERLEGLRRLIATDPTPAPIPIPPDPPAPSAMDQILEDALAPACRCFVCRNEISHPRPSPGCRCGGCELARDVTPPARCGNCRFISAYPNTECRRHAPAANGRAGDARLRLYPVVDIHDWCGDFEAVSCPR